MPIPDDIFTADYRYEPHVCNEGTNRSVDSFPHYRREVRTYSASEDLYLLIDTRSGQWFYRTVVRGTPSDIVEMVWLQLTQQLTTHNIRKGNADDPTVHQKATKKQTKSRRKPVRARSQAKVAILPENLFTKLKLKIKMMLPNPVRLTKKESGIVIENWENQSNKTATNANAMIRVSGQTETQIKDISKQINNVGDTLDQAKKAYALAKTDEEKEIIERRIVIAGETRDQLVASQERLDKVVKRVKETVEDARLAKLTLDSRIEEARIYRDIEGGLKMVGESLADAHQQHVVTKDEASKFELSMGALDSKITTRSRESLRQGAQKYLKEGVRKKAKDNGKEQ